MLKEIILPSYEPFIQIGIYKCIMLCGLPYWSDSLLHILRGKLRGSHFMLAVMTLGRFDMRLWLTPTLYAYILCAMPPPPPPPPPLNDDVIKWKQLPWYWPFVRGIHRWRWIFLFSLVCAWINGWVNNGEAGDLRRHHAHCAVIVMPAETR